MAAVQKADRETAVFELSDKPWLESFRDNSLMGATLPQLFRILWPVRDEIDYKVFVPRLIFLFVSSIFNTIFAICDYVMFSRVIRQTKIPPRPVFIIGHARSGTTLLHNLLSLDDRFFTPNVFQVGFASSFLTMERFANYWPFNSVLSSKRPMDNLALSWTVPCEDELATYVLSGGASHYMDMHFIRSYVRFLPYASFKAANVGDKFEEWRKSFLFFLRKLSYRYQTSLHQFESRLLLKSPVHLARVALLNAMFNDEAQFIHIHRHPYHVFQSQSRALVDKYFRPCTALQTFTALDAQGRILAHCADYERAFEEDIKKLNPVQVLHVSYDELVRDMSGTLKNVYGKLGIPLTTQVEEKFASYQSESRQYQPNKFKPLSEEAKELIWKHWQCMFKYGYER